ncbi:MAG: hypothetical protein JXA15_00850 [Spirochaetales bacterium]|nr:hypothetical protein [Spirochaetales bacterium]
MHKLLAMPGSDLVPPFCPRQGCVHHGVPERTDWFESDGHHETAAFGSVPRFRCKACGRSFSTQTFSVDYYAKKVVDYRELELLLSSSMSGRSLGRHFLLSPNSVQNRVDRLSRQALAVHSALRGFANPAEPVVVDGFQSLDRSQYFPNNITLSVSSGSLFLLEATHATLRRSGAMTEVQKRRREAMESKINYEPHALARSFTEILDQLAKERPPGPTRPLVLVTDLKKEYTHAFDRHAFGSLAKDQVKRVLVSSRSARTRSNPLFPVNYWDRELRKDQAAHRRETACHCRSAANGMARFWCYARYHNYRKRYPIRAHRVDQRTHADVAGIRKELRLALDGLYYRARAFLSRSELSVAGLKAWLKLFPTPGVDGIGRIPAFALD